MRGEKGVWSSYPSALTIFERLVIPDLVAEELRIHGVDLLHMDIPDLTFSMVSITAAQWQAVRQNAGVQSTQPADAQVFVLAESTQFRQLVLTDDLALRQHLEAHGNGFCAVSVIPGCQRQATDRSKRRECERVLHGDTVYGYGKKRTNSGPFRKLTDKHSIYP